MNERPTAGFSVSESLCGGAGEAGARQRHEGDAGAGGARGSLGGEAELVGRGERAAAAHREGLLDLLDRVLERLHLLAALALALGVELRELVLGDRLRHRLLLRDRRGLEALLDRVDLHPARRELRRLRLRLRRRLRLHPRHLHVPRALVLRLQLLARRVAEVLAVENLHPRHREPRVVVAHAARQVVELRERVVEVVLARHRPLLRRIALRVERLELLALDALPLLLEVRDLLVHQQPLVVVREVALLLERRRLLLRRDLRRERVGVDADLPLPRVLDPHQTLALDLPPPLDRRLLDVVAGGAGEERHGVATRSRWKCGFRRNCQVSRLRVTGRRELRSRSPARRRPSAALPSDTVCFFDLRDDESLSERLRVDGDFHTYKFLPLINKIRPLINNNPPLILKKSHYY